MNDSPPPAHTINSTLVMGVLEAWIVNHMRAHMRKDGTHGNWTIRFLVCPNGNRHLAAQRHEIVIRPCEVPYLTVTENLLLSIMRTAELFKHWKKNGAWFAGELGGFLNLAAIDATPFCQPGMDDYAHLRPLAEKIDTTAHAVFEFMLTHGPGEAGPIQLPDITGEILPS